MVNIQKIFKPVVTFRIVKAWRREAP